LVRFVIAREANQPRGDDWSAASLALLAMTSTRGPTNALRERFEALRSDIPQVVDVVHDDALFLPPTAGWAGTIAGM
jgi:hypothetical protein